ncbi:hypothetical protein CR513_59001, partial [Mucuna pruriens]
MISFFDACNIDMWDIIDNGQYIPTNKDGVEIPISSWNNKQKNKVPIKFQSYKFSHMCLNKSRVQVFKRDVGHIGSSYEGMSQVEDSKINMLANQYELFKMEDHKSIDQMFERFQTIINNLRSLGKTYDDYDHIMKILVSKDLKKLSMEEFLGMLKVHEIELNEDEGKIKGKSIAVKAQRLIKALHPNPSKHNSLMKKPQKKNILMRMNFFSSQERSTPCGNKREDLMEEQHQEKLRHFKSECPSLEKEKEKEKKKSSSKKKKGLMTTWEDFNLSSLEE